MRTFLAVAVLLVSACSAPGDPQPGEGETGGTFALGYLPGSRAREVRRDLVQQGLVVRTVDLATCSRPPGVVLAQRPPAGAAVSPGGVVRLTVARTPATASCVSSYAVDLVLSSP